VTPRVLGHRVGALESCAWALCAANSEQLDGFVDSLEVARTPRLELQAATGDEASLLRAATRLQQALPTPPWSPAVLEHTTN
jgi:hypothetical protein